MQLILCNFLILLLVSLQPVRSQEVILTLNIDDCVNCNRVVAASIAALESDNRILTVVVPARHRRHAEKYMREIVGTGSESYVLVFNDSLFRQYSQDERSTFVLLHKGIQRPIWRKKAVTMMPYEAGFLSKYASLNLTATILWNEDSSIVISDAYAIALQDHQPVIADKIYGSLFRPGNLPETYSIADFPWDKLYADIFGSPDTFRILMSYKHALGNLTEPKLVNVAVDNSKLVLALHLPYLHPGKDATNLACDYQSCLLTLGSNNEILSVSGPEGLYHQFTYGFAVNDGNAVSKSHQKFHGDDVLLSIVKNIYSDVKPQLLPDRKTKIPLMLVQKMDTAAYQSIGFHDKYLFFHFMPLAINMETQREIVFEELRSGQNTIMDIAVAHGRIVLWVIYDQQQLLRMVYDENSAALLEWSFIADATHYKTSGKAIDGNRFLILSKSDQLVELTVAL